ncbi:MAG TPA: enoyl-CoA hydratase/isomerase family protein [Conexibacter sp.]|nr:enoyl-CoA hydratase/isomerase family protein [Conexibacter sp.]
MTTRAGAVRLRVDGDVLHATIDRPQARNAIDHEVVDGLAATVATAREAGVKVVVLRGAGGSFCAGADLKLVRSLLDDPAGLDAFLSRLGAVFEQLERAPWVTVAVVEGHAVAGGCELLLACDVVIAADDARIGDAHVERGLVPGGGSSVRLPRTVQRLRARWLLLSGETVSGAAAVDLGLATFAVPAGELDAEVERIVARLSSRGRATLATVKAMLAEEPGAPAGDTPSRLRRELDLFLAHVTDAPDARTGLDAFVQR